MERKHFVEATKRLLAKDPAMWRGYAGMKEMAKEFGFETHVMVEVVAKCAAEGLLSESWNAAFRQALAELPRDELAKLASTTPFVRQLLDAIGYERSE